MEKKNNLNHLIVGNWKMNPVSVKEAKNLAESVRKEVSRFKNNNVEVVICPPSIWLGFLAPFLSNDSRKKALLKMGGQDAFWETKGAYTGEVSAAMLKNLGCQYVILGHSERRRYFQESDQLINEKVKAALKSGLEVILCVGEQEKEDEGSDDVSLAIKDQLEADLEGVSASKIDDVTIAYEPVWAIGTGQPCSPHQAMEAALFIRKILTRLYSRKTADKTRVLYGGSVTSRNAVDYLNDLQMNGLLIGGASLKADEFIKIIEKTEK